MANILNIEVGILTSDEGPALGSAILAAVGDGAYPDVATACQTIVKVRETIQPDPVTFQKYENFMPSTGRATLPSAASMISSSGWLLTELKLPNRILNDSCPTQ